jgi:geranylgeranyl pyrophosphate synthase
VLRYFFDIDGGKKIRPSMVLAVSYALNAQVETGSGSNSAAPHGLQGRGLVASPSQKRLAEITEMIHTASLFHDDVIDKVRHRKYTTG